MKKFKDLVREFYDYPPTTSDEKKFLNIHITKVVDYPVKNKDGLPFRDDSIKAPGPQHKKRATYEPPHEPTAVYKAANKTANEEKKDDNIEREIRDFRERGGTVKVGKTKNAKGITYMRNMSRQKGSSSSAKASFREESIVENSAARDKAYPMSYERGSMSDSQEVHHVNLDLTKSPDYRAGGRISDTDGRPRHPERTKKLVREHPLHKEMIAKGFKLRAYGEHGEGMFGRTFDTKGNVVKDNRKKKVNEAFEKMDTESLKARHKRFSDSLMKSPKATATSTDSHLDILDMHDELTKRGVRVEYPQHQLFDVERAEAKRKAAKTKKVTQESLMDINVDSNEIFESDDIMSLLAIVSDTGNTAEVFFEGAEDSVEIDKDLADMLLAAYEELSEEDQDDFEANLAESEDAFGRCVDFAFNMLNG